MRFLSRRRPASAPETAATEPVLELTRADLVAGDGDAGIAVAAKPDLSALREEIACVGEYVARLRREIAAVRPNETADMVLPSLRGELSAIGTETSRAAETIMSAAEALLRTDEDCPVEVREQIAEQATEIMQACSFQDVAGQRLDRAITTLRTLEERMRRFKDGTSLADGRGFDRASITRDVRRDVLMVDGPARPAVNGVDQGEVDRLFG